MCHRNLQPRSIFQCAAQRAKMSSAMSNGGFNAAPDSDVRTSVHDARE